MVEIELGYRFQSDDRIETHVRMGEQALPHPQTSPSGLNLMLYPY